MDRLLYRHIDTALQEFMHDLRGRPWFGREHEAVSLFVLGHLQRHVIPPTRIAIGGTVRGVEQAKKQVCKDVVIWPEAGRTYWDGSWDRPGNEPDAILEWKVATPKSRRRCKPEREKDVAWLRKFARRLSPDAGFLGYSVLLTLDRGGPSLDVLRARPNEPLEHGAWARTGMLEWTLT
jgi:hypothetical protein